MTDLPERAPAARHDDHAMRRLDGGAVHPPSPLSQGPVVELTTPQTVDGRRAPFQSLWLLVRLVQAAQAGEPRVAVAELSGAISEAKTLRMVISRAFRDFAAWGVSAGWGDDAARDPRFLNVERRSQGPFWLAAGDMPVLQVTGQPATAADIAAFLGQGAGTGPALQTLPDPAALPFWQQMASAQQALRHGALVSATGAGSALSALKAAACHAHTPQLEAQRLLTEAWVWRRLGDSRQALACVRRLQRLRRGAGLVAAAEPVAMQQLLLAWCAYDRRELDRARNLLATMQTGHTALLAHHPQIGFEWHNLWALTLRSTALAAPQAHAAAALAAEALAHFGHALAIAQAQGQVEATQQAAANHGMALWLFHAAGLRPLPDAAAQAVRWIAYSEWLCQQAGNRQPSVWNALFLMRIARGAAVAPCTPAQLAAWADPFADALAQFNRPGGWRAVAEALLYEHDSGQRRYPATQLCGLLFEALWHGSGVPAAVARRERLLALLPELSAADRAYYRDGLASLAL
ncbi:hypothetical protein N8I74_17375 [Chitiniphilus purpureus]|uniref:Uncharacterized protein n=1 Tax=Chitiniphilus purpureus TaxID=2981137 RepID=A0ABY6DM29_9NEIS|nr:hypothetical protein [Chitiniphilus sp. CD1]UXY15062.1 hypothetical protein N8I74_17375 [Chitiniphilus sp. CD1]